MNSNVEYEIKLQKIEHQISLDNLKKLINIR